MAQTVAELQPGALWKQFAELTTVPRPSKKEARVRAWTLAWAAKHQFETREDSCGNIVVAIPATQGREQAPTIVIQSHLDMVCEKNRDVTHDFERDALKTRIEDGWVVAEGTTLGADNGIGVAAAMGVATDPTIAHGPLELLFTIDEETGLTGAANLDGAMIHGRTLLNLDTEEDGALTIGCAGGADTRLSLPLARAEQPSHERRVTLELLGLRGGHSGMNIHENRGNAIRLLARVLEDAQREKLSFGLLSFSGGDKSNAIPREAEAQLTLPADANAAWEAHLAKWLDILRVEFSGIDEGARLVLREGAEEASEIQTESASTLLHLLLALPHGVLAMSPTIPGLVESSSNVAALSCTSESAEIVTSSRSSLAPALDSIRASIRAAAELCGASWRVTDAYPGWQPDPTSRVTEQLREVYREIWGKEPSVTAVHAGLECGLLGSRISGLDMISFGPTIEGAHSPDERVEIAAVERFWRALALALDRLSS